MIIERATKDDLPEILALQKLAYHSGEATIYNDFNIAPFAQSLEDLREDFKHHTYIKAVLNDNIIGSVRGCYHDKTCYIGRLIILPQHQNTGIGTALMQYIEKAFKQAKRFQLFTGLRSKRNLYLYQKIGYRLYKAEKITHSLIIVFLEKKKDHFTMTMM